jgi:asparagine synthase (glutamine-hydrolysing)
MLSAVAHRGPDDDGIWLEPRRHAGLAASRLALTDAGPAGTQPMVDERGNAVVFNGFVSNYLSLRARLKDGWNFRSDGDTECILAASRRWPENFTDQLWGMYAFALWDGGRLQLSRDPVGARPLYYAVVDGDFYFASDVRALLPWMRPSISLRGLAEYLVFQYPVSEGTTFQGISRVLPGETVYVSGGGIRRKQSANAAAHRRVLEPSADLEDADRLRGLVLDAAERYVPPRDKSAVALSGGVDSSSVLAAVFAGDAGRPEALHGYVCGEPSCDESRYAREISAELACDLHEVAFSRATFLEALPRVIRELGHPVAGAGAVNQFIVARAAAERGVRVLLGGQGGDELFGGYVRYSVLEGTCRREAAGSGGMSGHGEPASAGIPAGYESWARSFGSALPDPATTYLEMIDRRDGVRGEWDWLDEEAVRGEVGEEFRTSLSQTGSCVAAATGVDLRWGLPALLHVDDSVCMAHGIESRTPLLDDGIRDHALALPADRRFGASRKSLLIRAMSAHVPSSILSRSDKMGFPIPLTKWMLGDDPGWLMEVLKNSSARGRPWALRDPETYVAGLGGRPYSRSVWGLVSLEFWALEYVEGY